MLKEFWNSCNIIQKIAAIFWLLIVIAGHIAAFYGLIAMEWVAEEICPQVVARILFLLLWTALISLDTVSVVIFLF